MITDALRTILKEEGWQALYRGIAPSLFLVRYCHILIFLFLFPFFKSIGFIFLYLSSGDVCCILKYEHSSHRFVSHFEYVALDHFLHC